MLHLPVFSDVDPAAQQRLPDADRLSGFDEVLAGLTEPAARHEAQRCLSCGVCFECDNCFAACPEQAIAKLGPGLRLRGRCHDLHRLRDVLRAVPLPRHPDGREADRMAPP